MTSLHFEFNCEKCGARVMKRPDAFDHDHCPECKWSKHTNYGYADQPPCLSMMRPTSLPNSCGELALWECEGCSYEYINPREYVATIERYQELKMARHQKSWLWPEQHPRGAAIWRMVKGEWKAEVLVEPVYAR